jgi:2-haloacid dehalogenase
MSMVRNIVFDCNESILDLTTVTPVFQRLFGEPSALRLWFRQLITYSQALTIADVYVPFTDISGAVLEMIAKPQGIKITAADRQELTDRFATMQPYPDVTGGLRRLKASAFHLFTLIDNGAAISGRQLTHGGLPDLFGHSRAGRVTRGNVHGRLPYLGHHRGSGGGVGGCAHQARQQQCPGYRCAASVRRKRS